MRSTSFRVASVVAVLLSACAAGVNFVTPPGDKL